MAPPLRQASSSRADVLRIEGGGMHEAGHRGGDHVDAGGEHAAEVVDALAPAATRRPPCSRRSRARARAAPSASFVARDAERRGARELAGVAPDLRRAVHPHAGQLEVGPARDRAQRDRAGAARRPLHHAELTVCGIGSWLPIAMKLACEGARHDPRPVPADRPGRDRDRLGARHRPRHRAGLRGGRRPRRLLRAHRRRTSRRRRSSCASAAARASPCAATCSTPSSSSSCVAATLQQLRPHRRAREQRRRRASRARARALRARLREDRALQPDEPLPAHAHGRAAHGRDRRRRRRREHLVGREPARGRRAWPPTAARRRASTS